LLSATINQELCMIYLIMYDIFFTSLTHFNYINKAFQTAVGYRPVPQLDFGFSQFHFLLLFYIVFKVPFAKGSWNFF